MFGSGMPGSSLQQRYAGERRGHSAEDHQRLVEVIRAKKKLGAGPKHKESQ
jgi:hypothetical protein